MAKAKNVTYEINDGDTVSVYQDDTEYVPKINDKYDETEETPAWMRYMPKLLANSQDMNTKLRIPIESETLCGEKKRKKFSSNRFSPCREVVTTISVRAKRKHSDADVDCKIGTTINVGTELVQTRKKVYRRYNVDEASMLLSMFDLKK